MRPRGPGKKSNARHVWTTGPSFRWTVAGVLVLLALFRVLSYSPSRVRGNEPHGRLLASRNAEQRVRAAVRNSARTNPFSSTWENSVLTCAIIKDEHSDDLREWLQYHRCV